jgi:hypothetical protein
MYLVTTKPAPRDLDVLLIMDEDFEVEWILPAAREAFDSTRARLRFEADVFSPALPSARKSRVDSPM